MEFSGCCIIILLLSIGQITLGLSNDIGSGDQQDGRDSILGYNQGVSDRDDQHLPDGLNLVRNLQDLISSNDGDAEYKDTSVLAITTPNEDEVTNKLLVRGKRRIIRGGRSCPGQCPGIGSFPGRRRNGRRPTRPGCGGPGRPGQRNCRPGNQEPVGVSRVPYGQLLRNRRCRRGAVASCLRPSNRYRPAFKPLSSGGREFTTTMKRRYSHLRNGGPTNDRVAQAKRSFRRQMTGAQFERFKTKYQAIANPKMDQAEAYAVHLYTMTSGNVNENLRALEVGQKQVYPDHAGMDHVLTRREIRGALGQAELIQSGLKKSKSSGTIQVYRDEKKYPGFDEKFNTGRIGKTTSFSTFTSTTKLAGGVGGQWSGPAYNVRYNINTRSGVDVSQLTKFPEQQEVLLPLGPKYQITGFREENGRAIIDLTETCAEEGG